MSGVDVASGVPVRVKAGKAYAMRCVLSMEMIERFGYYSIQSTALFFLMNALGFDAKAATLLWSTFSSITFAAPSVGGWIGDHLLGTKRTALIGCFMLACGYFGLALPHFVPGQVYWSFALIAAADGFFKPNIACLVRHIHAEETAGLEIAFTLYYMGISIGSTVGLLLTPLISKYFNINGAFLISAVLVSCGTVWFMGQCRGRLAHLGSLADRQPLRPRLALGMTAAIVCAIGAIAVILRHAALSTAIVWVVTILLVGIWVRIFRMASVRERLGLKILYLLAAQTMLFFVFNQQIGTSLTLFARDCVDPDFFLIGTPIFSLLPGQFQALNTVWLLAASPVLLWIYAALARRGWDLSLPTKFILGFMCLALSFLAWWGGDVLHGEGRISAWWMVLAYGLFSLGELLVSALGLAVVARYAPAHKSGLLMGTFFVTNGIGMYLGGMLAGVMPAGLELADQGVLFAAYARFFMLLFVMVCAGIAAFLALWPVVRRWERLFCAHPD